MSTDRQLLQQALKALEFEADGWEDPPHVTRNAIAALRARLAEPDDTEARVQRVMEAVDGYTKSVAAPVVIRHASVLRMSDARSELARAVMEAVR